MYLNTTIFPYQDLKKEVKSRTGTASIAFNKLNNIWKSEIDSTGTKLKIFN